MSKAQNIIDLYRGGHEAQARQMCDSESLTIEQDETGTRYTLGDGSNIELNAAGTMVVYTIEQGGEPVDNGDFASLAEARQGMADLEAALGWRDMRIVRNAGPRTNLSGRMLTGADANEVIEYGTASA